MKKYIFISVLSVGFLFIFWSAKSQNLIQNPGFESNLSGWGYWSNGNTGGATIVKDIVHSGNNAAKIQYPGTKDWAFNSSAKITVNAGDIYEMSYWSKFATAPSEAYFSVVLYDSKQAVVNWVFNRLPLDKSQAEYKYNATTLIIPEGVKYIQPRFEGWAACDLYVDDISLTKVENTGITGDFTIENESVKAVIHLPVLSIDITNKLNSKTYKTGMAQFASVKSVEQVGQQSILMKAELLSGSNSPIDIRLTLAENAIKIELLGDEEIAINSDMKFPGIIPNQADEYFIIPRGTGVMIPVTSSNPFGDFNTYTWKSTMPFVGATNLKEGYMIATDDQWDAAFRFEKPAGQSNFSFQLNQKPSKSKLAYNRTSYLVLINNGYVEMCNWYRNHAEKMGYVKTFSQKQMENPNIDKLIGAVDFWALSFTLSPSFLKNIKLMGMDKAIWNLTGGWGTPNFSTIIDSINSMGFLSGRYDIFTDVWPPDHPTWHYRTEGYPEDVVVEKNGDLKKGWLAFQNDIPFQGYYTCAETHLAYAKKYVTADLETNRYNTRFVDVELSSSLEECFSPTHPVTRKEDAEARNSLLSYIKNDLNLVTGVEEAHDFAFQNVDYGEGTMTIIPATNAGYDWSQPLEPDDKTYELQNISTEMRIPLHGLVYHDVHIPTWYTGDGVSKVPAFWDDKDLWNILYGTMPLYLPPSLQYWNTNLEKFMSGYNLITAVSRNVGYAKMIDHRFLTNHKQIQQTTFDNGWRVTVNFDNIPQQWNNKTLAAKGFYASNGEKDESFKLVVNDKTIAGAFTNDRLFFNPFGTESNWNGLRTTQSVFMQKFPDYLLVSFIGKQNYLDLNTAELPFDVDEITKVTEYLTGATLTPVVLSDGWLRLNRPNGKSFFKVYYKSKITGIGTIHGNSDLKVFPNPAQNQITIELPKIASNDYYTISNLNGSKLITNQITGQKTEVDISSLVAGVYFLNLVVNKNTEIRKFVKF